MSNANPEHATPTTEAARESTRKDSVATAPRDRRFIARRRRMFEAIEKVRHRETGLKGWLSRLTRRSQAQAARSIAVLPAVRDTDDLSDLVNRISWYLPNPEVTVHIAGPTRVSVDSLRAPTAQADVIASRKCKVVLGAPSPRRSDLILIRRWKEAGRQILRLHKSVIVDEQYYSSSEADTWARLHWKTLDVSDRAELKMVWQANWQSLVSRLGNPATAYVIATGPTADRAHEIDYDMNSVRIICNSAVKNAALLERCHPSVIAFADPVFHFGVSRYAAEFRRYVVSAVEKYDAFCLVPSEQAALLTRQCASLSSRVIGVDVENTDSWIIPSGSDRRVRGMGNVLTLFMLPFAISLAQRRISIIGADGRRPDENYFWKHSERNQFTGLMESAFDTHPSFFRDRDYEDYYGEHCRSVESLIHLAEGRGLHVQTLSPSFIPSLRSRFVANTTWPALRD